MRLAVGVAVHECRVTGTHTISMGKFPDTPAATTVAQPTPHSCCSPTPTPIKTAPILGPGYRLLSPVTLLAQSHVDRGGGVRQALCVEAVW